VHARVVRFTDVQPERIQAIKERIAEEDGPPPGVDSTGFKLFYDESQGTALFVGFFENAEKMQAANEVFEQMDPGDVPGSRASVDMAEVVLERDMDD
jgi:hypothetical protein